MSFNGNGGGGGGDDGFIPPEIAPYYVNGWERSDHGNFYVEYTAAAQDVECRVRIATLQSVTDRQFRIMALAGDPRQDPRWYDRNPAVEQQSHAELEDAARRLVDLLERVSPDAAVAQLRNSELFDADAKYPEWTDALPSPGTRSGTGRASIGQGGDLQGSKPGWPRRVNGWEREWADSSSARYSAVLDRSEAGGDMVGAYISLSLVQVSTGGGEQYVLRWEYALDGPMGEPTDSADSPAFDTYNRAAQRLKQTLERFTPGVFLGDIREGDPPWGEADIFAGGRDPERGVAGFPPEVNGWDLSVENGEPEYRAYDDAGELFARIGSLVRTESDGTEEFQVFYQHSETASGEIETGRSVWLATSDEAQDLMLDMVAEWTPGEFTNAARRGDPFAQLPGWPDIHEAGSGRDQGQSGRERDPDDVDVPDEIGRWELRRREDNTNADYRWPTYAYYPQYEDTTVRMVELEFRGRLDTPTGWGVVAHVFDSPPGVTGDNRTDLVYHIPDDTHAAALQRFVEFARANSPRDILRNYETDSGYDYRQGSGGR